MLSLVHTASGIEQSHSSTNCGWINAEVLSYFLISLALNFHLVHHAPSEGRVYSTSLQRWWKGPLRVDSYRGVTLTSVVAKVLEFLLLDRLQLVFMEAGLPHMNQSAYRKAVSCADAIFATQEIVARYLRGGSRVYMCLHDLQKAFDSVEYPVLLEELYNVGVNGKMWKLFNSWYTGRLMEGYQTGLWWRGV